MTDDRTSTELRRRLAEQAQRAPSGDLVAERVIARAGSPAPRRTLPRFRLMAVAAAVLAVAGVAVVVSRSGDDGPRRDVADRPSSVAPATTPAPLSSTESPTPEAESSEPTPLSSTARRITVPTLSDVRIAAVTFTAGGNGWALGSAKCLRASGRCTALLHTDDGGDSWKGRPNTPFQVPGVRDCSSPCVDDLRFATDSTGYAFGRDALFLTTDGARTWRRLDGGADALETLDGTVIRVSSDASSCPPGCSYRVRVSDVGSTSWRTVALPGTAGAGDGVALSRTDGHAYLLGYGNPAGGAASARSVLWSSADGGRSWRNRGEPCPQTGGDEVDSTALTTAADGAVALVCRARESGAQAIAVSTDDGGDFTAKSSGLGSAEVTTFGAATADVLLVSTDDTYRTVDAGARFVRSKGVGRLAYLGFASPRVAHAVAADTRTVYTSTDAGRTWRAARFT